MVMRKKIVSISDTFMKQIGMHENNIDLDAELIKYCRDMEDGLNGNGGLPMVPSFISGRLEPKQKSSVIAIDVGGTNLRIALFYLNKRGRLCMRRLGYFELPGRKCAVTAEQFFDTLAGYVEPYLTFSRKISFSFAHEITPLPDHDGYAGSLSKELVIKGLPNARLGEGLKKALTLRGLDDTDIIVFNDTIGVAAAMSNKSKSYDGFIGLVTGTGTNTCYPEQSRHITKLSHPYEGTMYINVESGEYAGMQRGKADYYLDKESGRPGSALLEKMISGGYIGQLFWQTISIAVEQGLVSGSLIKAFHAAKPPDTLDFSRFMGSKPTCDAYTRMCGCKSDRALLKAIGTSLIKRGAKLIALEIAGAAVRSGKGLNPDRPICIISEGTTYYSLPGLKQEVEKLIYGWLKAKGTYVVLKKVDNAALKGIGLVGLSML